MKDKDLKIIKSLRKDSRMSLTQMSKDTKIPVSTIFDRLKTNEAILKNTSLIDFSRLGYNTKSKLLLKVEKKDRDNFEEFAVKNENVNSVFKITNSYDYLIEVIFKNMNELNDFKEEVEEKFDVKDIESLYIINELKREGFMSFE